MQNPHDMWNEYKKQDILTFLVLDKPGLKRNTFRKRPFNYHITVPPNQDY